MEKDMQQVAELLKKEQNTPEEILQYSVYTFEAKKDIPKAFQMLLNLLGTVKETNQIFKNIKYYMAKVIKTAESLDIILELPFWKELSNTQSAAIYAWLGLIVKEYGGLNQSITLLNKAISIFPNHHAYVLNLVHILEIELKYQEALEISLRLIQDTLPDFAFNTSNGQLLSTTLNCKLTEKDLDLLSLIFNTIKILFLQGKLTYLKDWYDKIASLIAKSFSLTENLDFLSEYYKYIKELIKYLSLDKFEENRKNCKPVYILGDSNCLSLAYHTIELKSEKRIFIPQLVNSLKIWHLRDDSEYFTKYNYFNIINSLRNEKVDYICFILGSCDLKDGFDYLTEKGNTKSEAEIINMLIDIYLSRLRELSIFLRCCKILICPVLPIYDQSKNRFVLFNSEFEKKMKEEKNGNLIYIGGFENELASNKLKYYLDGHHFNPLWIKIVSYWNTNFNECFMLLSFSKKLIQG
jgi:tetratricopeptide (TPR) repeat protein